MLAALVVAAAVVAAPAEAQRTLSPADAVHLAYLDASKQPLDKSRYIRYVWNHRGSYKHAQAFSAVLNFAVVTAAEPLQFPPVPGTNNQLIRIDLARACPQREDLERVLRVWDELAERESYFHVQRDLVVEVKETRRKRRKVTVPRYLADDGRYYDWKWVEEDVVELTEVTEKRVDFAVGSDRATLVDLGERTDSLNPIMRLDQAVRLLLDDYDGGVYSKIRGFDQFRAEGGRTALENLLAAYGADVARVRELRADERAAMLRSEVTGKPRSMLFFLGIGRVSATNGLFTITDDPFDENHDPNSDAIRQLLDLRSDGHEIIWQLPNGFLAFALANGQQDLVFAEGAPQNLVADHNIPRPYTKTLRSAISCIRCHTEGGGYVTFYNDVKSLRRLGLAATDDLASDKDARDTYDRLQGIYGGDPRVAVAEARRRHADAIFRATAFRAGDGLSPQDTYATITEIYDTYTYDLITPQVACMEMGFLVPAEHAAALFNQLVPRLPAGETPEWPEDPYIQALRGPDPTDGRWLPVTRANWEPIFADVMLRAITELAKQRQGQNKPQDVSKEGNP